MSREILTSPVLELAFPKISRPDTFGEKADGKFKTLAKLTGSKAGEAFKKRIEDKAKELLPKTKKPKLPFWTNDDGDTFLRASSKYRPLVQDAKGNDIPPKSVEAMKIGGGTTGRLQIALNPFDGRLSLYLNGLQIVSLKQYESKGAKGFSEVEGDGYVYDGPAADEADDKSDDKSDDKDAGDDDYKM